MEEQNIISDGPKFTPYPEIWTRSYRVYVLVKVTENTTIEEKEKIASSIFNLNEEKHLIKDRQGFIVRADVVAGSEDFEILVPVNAPGEDELEAIFTHIDNLSGVVSKSIIKVEVTIPKKAHQAKGYVPFNERNPTIGIDGHNAWG